MSTPQRLTTHFTPKPARNPKHLCNTQILWRRQLKENIRKPGTDSSLVPEDRLCRVIAQISRKKSSYIVNNVVSNPFENASQLCDLVAREG
jgi:hypothetical protein